MGTQELYEKYASELYDIVYKRVGFDEQATQDIMQEVWLAVTRNIDGFNGKSSCRSWVWSITRFKITDYYRNKYKCAEVEILDTHADSSMGIQDWVEQQETKEQVRQAISSLPEQYGKVLKLRYLEDRPAREVAGIVGSTKKGVESMLDRARSALRAQLGGSAV